MTTTNELGEIVSFVKEMLHRAQLAGKVFSLGFLFEDKDVLLHRIVAENLEVFEALGAIELEWKHDGLRDKRIIAGEELYISVRGIE